MENKIERVGAMIPEHIREEILRRLKYVEESENVRILLAVESGSRAWGFASPNSDYDVRFIYARPKEWYLCIDLEERRDVLEYGIVDDIDLNGWDVRKALRLFGRSNPAFVEWIQSPIVYLQAGCFADSARELLSEVYSVEKGVYHYRSMAKTNYREYLRAEQVPLKKYFYALRPLLAVKWLDKYGSAAPIEFDGLLTLVADSSELIQAIEALLGKKKASDELELGPRIPLINDFIEAELERLEPFKGLEAVKMNSVALLNELFDKVLGECS